MRSDVKLGLAVGGLLLGVVLAYALFFSNTNKDRKDLADSGYSALGSGDTAQKPAPAPQANTDQTATDSNPPIVNSNPPPAIEHSANPIVDAAPANPLIGKSWQLLLNEGATANSTGTITSGGEHATPPSIRNSNPPTETLVTQPPPRNTVTLADPPAPPTGPRRYTIKNGDTFWIIAKAEYGNGAYYSHIQRANPGIDPGRIKAGDSIILPDKSDVVPSPAAAATARQPSAADAVNIDPTKQYRVQPGDNLHNISKKLYGRFDKWAQIYELNKELIGPNPAALKRDMILALPERPVGVATTIQ
jgi:nucleoid-associated protein YgaU